MVRFNQYMRGGRVRERYIARGQDVELKASRLLDMGAEITAVVVPPAPAVVLLTVDKPPGEPVVAIEIVPNGPEVPGAVDRLVERAYAELQAGLGGCQ